MPMLEEQELTTADIYVTVKRRRTHDPKTIEQIAESMIDEGPSKVRSDVFTPGLTLCSHTLRDKHFSGRLDRAASPVDPKMPQRAPVMVREDGGADEVEAPRRIGRCSLFRRFRP